MQSPFLFQGKPLLFFFNHLIYFLFSLLFSFSLSLFSLSLSSLHGASISFSLSSPPHRVIELQSCKPCILLSSLFFLSSLSSKFISFSSFSLNFLTIFFFCVSFLVVYLRGHDNKTTKINKLTMHSMIDRFHEA